MQGIFFRDRAPNDLMYSNLFSPIIALLSDTLEYTYDEDDDDAHTQINWVQFTQESLGIFLPHHNNITTTTKLHTLLVLLTLLLSFLYC